MATEDIENHPLLLNAERIISLHEKMSNEEKEELAKWDPSSFKVDTKVLESGRTTYSIGARRKIKSLKKQDYTKNNGNISQGDDK